MPLSSHPVRAGLAAMIALALAASTAAASGDKPRRPNALPPPLYQQECGACHLAYPAELLPAESWQRLMSQLPHHYGTDASLDAATRDELVAWLTANAANGRRAGTAPPQDRITQSAWFLREHAEVPPATWKRPAVKSPAQCAACHIQAAEGDFNEHRVRIPR